MNTEVDSTDTGPKMWGSNSIQFAWYNVLKVEIPQISRAFLVLFASLIFHIE